MDISLIGSGLDGSVYNPPLSKYLNDRDMVGKIGVKEIILKEFNMLDSLSEKLNGIKNIHKPSFFYLTNISSEFDYILEDNEEIMFYLENYPAKLSQLIIPFLPGITLEDYFSSFKFFPYKYRVQEQEYKKNTNTNIISLDEFLTLNSALLLLFSEIKSLNRTKIYHNDINLSNIMYNDGRLILFDWARGTLDKRGINEELELDDIEFITLIFEEFVYLSIQNKQIYNLLKSNGFLFYNSLIFENKADRELLTEIIHNEKDIIKILSNI